MSTDGRNGVRILWRQSESAAQVLRALNMYICISPLPYIGQVSIRRDSAHKASKSFRKHALNAYYVPGSVLRSVFLKNGLASFKELKLTQRENNTQYNECVRQTQIRTTKIPHQEMALPSYRLQMSVLPKVTPSGHPHPLIGSGRVIKLYGPMLDTLMGNTFSRAFHWVVLRFLRSPSQLDVFLYSIFLPPSSTHKCWP